jgi:integrase
MSISLRPYLPLLPHDPAAKAAGLERFRPYDLRHSFVSLLLAGGRSVVELAKQAGRSPTMSLATYGHVIEALDTTQRRALMT